ncbi:MAG: hypothetical protein AAB539_00315 [Patescibacteria group bacterium]
MVEGMPQESGAVPESKKELGRSGRVKEWWRAEFLKWYGGKSEKSQDAAVEKMEAGPVAGTETIENEPAGYLDFVKALWRNEIEMNMSAREREQMQATAEEIGKMGLIETLVAQELPTGTPINVSWQEIREWIGENKLPEKTGIAVGLLLLGVTPLYYGGKWAAEWFVGPDGVRTFKQYWKLVYDAGDKWLTPKEKKEGGGGGGKKGRGGGGGGGGRRGRRGRGGQQGQRAQGGSAVATMEGSSEGEAPEGGVSSAGAPEGGGESQESDTGEEEQGGTEGGVAGGTAGGGGTTTEAGGTAAQEDEDEDDEETTATPPAPPPRQSPARQQRQPPQQEGRPGQNQRRRRRQRPRGGRGQQPS